MDIERPNIDSAATDYNYHLTERAAAADAGNAFNINNELVNLENNINNEVGHHNNIINLENMDENEDNDENFQHIADLNENL